MNPHRIVPLLILCALLAAALPAATVATPTPQDKIEPPILEEIDAAGHTGPLGFGLPAVSAGLPASSPVPVQLSTPAAITPDPLIQQMIDQVTTPTVSAYDRQLAGELPIWVDGGWYTLTTRYLFSGEPISRTVKWAGQHFANDLGLDVEYHRWKGPDYPSVIAEISGQVNPEDVYIISAHVDTVAGSPGADDNGSGSVAVMMAADIMSQYQWGCTLRFALWTGEEISHGGSLNYARRAHHRSEHLGGVINLDMIAYAPPGNRNIWLYACSAITPTVQLAWLFSDTIQAYNLNLDPLISYGYNQSSDHASFWLYGYPAIWGFESTTNPCWHQPCDTPAQTDLSYFTEYVKASIAAFAHASGCLLPNGVGRLGGTITTAGGAPIPGAAVRAADGAGRSYSETTDPSGYYSHTLPTGTYTVTASAYGFLPATVGGVGIVTNVVSTRDLSLTAAPTYVVSGTVREAGSGAPLYAQVMIEGAPIAPVWTDPATGFYSFPAAAGTHSFLVTSTLHKAAVRRVVVDHDQTQSFELEPVFLVPYAGDPVLDIGSPGSWDDFSLGFPDVVFDHGVAYLFYTGADMQELRHTIGYATSPDGLSFTRPVSDPILAGDGTGFDAYSVWFPQVLVEDDAWVLYYSGVGAYSPSQNGYRVGRATAPGPAGPWTRGADPVLSVGSAGEWDSGSVAPSSVVATPEGYVMYYTGWGQGYAIGRATSPDGLNWTKYNDPSTPYPPYAESDPVLRPGASGEWDAANVMGGAVRETAGGWEMFFSGMDYNGAIMPLGYATSADGIDWFRYAYNPVLQPLDDPAATNRVGYPSVVLSDTTYLVYYDYALEPGGIGLAIGGGCMPLAEAIFSWQPVTPTLGEAITLTAGAAGTDPVTFTWDLGDDITATGRVISHTYAAAGTYTVTLTATNCQMGMATAVHTITVEPTCIPVEGADFSWQPVTPTVDEAITFTGTVAAGAPPITYSWSLGDSSFVLGPSIITHTYALPGDYVVVLTATNCATGTAVASHTLSVVCPEVAEAGFAWAPDVPEEGAPVTFTATASSTRPLSYTWDLGDGTITRGITVTHAYTPAGDYLVTLTATNDCGAWQAVTDTLTVTSTCQAVGIVSVTAAVSGCVAPLEAELTGESPFTYRWDLGPFGTYSEANPVVDFRATGTYTGTLSVWNCGNPEPATLNFAVEVACRWYFIYLPLVVK